MSRREGVYWPGVVLVGLVLLASVGFGAWAVTDWVKVATADTVDATVTEVDRSSVRTSSNRNDWFIEYETADGETRSEGVNSRILWRPEEGQEIQVYEKSRDNWEVAQEFSWPGAVLILLACLVPWALLYLVVDDKVAKRRTKSDRARA